MAWDYLENQTNRVIPQKTGLPGQTYFTHKGVFGYQVSPAGFRRRFLDPALVRIILHQDNCGDSELLRTLKDMRREASNWQIQHGVAVYHQQMKAFQIHPLFWGTTPRSTKGIYRLLRLERLGPGASC